MLLVNRNKLQLSFLGISSAIVFGLVSCSSLNQQPYDIDGVYYNSKIPVEKSHEKSTYYTEYFKELDESNDSFFTDIDSYSSNNYNANPGWGDDTSETYLHLNNSYMNWGWNMPYYYGYNNFWGFNHGFGVFYGYPSYFGFGWGYPYYYGYYGWGFPYNSFRNISRSNVHRNINNRSLVSNSRNLMNSSRSSNNLLRSSRTFANETTQRSRMGIIDNQRRNNNIDRLNNSSNSRINNSNRVNSNINRSSSRPTYTPSSSNARMNNTGSFGGSRSGGMSSGMRTSTGRR